VPARRPEPRLSQELIAFVQGGVAVSVATRDAELRPTFTRGWGTVSLCVTAPPGSASRSNLEQNAALAIGFSPPTIARALQVKGLRSSCESRRLLSSNVLSGISRPFSAETETLGYPPELARRLYRPPDFASVTLSIDEVFDQTPGPSAGRHL
jgi:hypothetical protein